MTTGDYRLSPGYTHDTSGIRAPNAPPSEKPFRPELNVAGYDGRGRDINNLDYRQHTPSGYHIKTRRTPDGFDTLMRNKNGFNLDGVNSEGRIVVQRARVQDETKVKSVSYQVTVNGKTETKYKKVTYVERVVHWDDELVRVPSFRVDLTKDMLQESFRVEREIDTLGANHDLYTPENRCIDKWKRKGVAAIDIPRAAALEAIRAMEDGVKLSVGYLASKSIGATCFAMNQISGKTLESMQEGVSSDSTLIPVTTTETQCLSLMGDNNAMTLFTTVGTGVMVLEYIAAASLLVYAIYATRAWWGGAAEKVTEIMAPGRTVAIKRGNLESTYSVPGGLIGGFTRVANADRHIPQ